MPERIRGKIAHAAYEQAWRQFCGLGGLTSSERHDAAMRLRRYVKMMVDHGERDPNKIAKAAVGPTLAPQQTGSSNTDRAA